MRDPGVRQIVSRRLGDVPGRKPFGGHATEWAHQGKLLIYQISDLIAGLASILLPSEARVGREERRIEARERASRGG